MELERQTSLRARRSPSLLLPLGILASYITAIYLHQKLRQAPNRTSTRPVKKDDDTKGKHNIGMDEEPDAARRPRRAEPPPTPPDAGAAKKGSGYLKKLRRAGLFWIQLGTLLGLVWYATITRNQWIEMVKATGEATKSAGTAQKQFEASARPWLKIVDVQTRGNNQIPALSFQRSPTWPPGTQQATFQLDISYKNIGQSVATVTVDFELFLPLWKNGYSDVILDSEKKFCDSVARINPAPTLSVINFPGDEPYHWYGGGAAAVNADSTNYFSDRSPGVGFILPVVAICVNYQFGDSPKVYQTRALYEVFRKDDRSRFFEVGIGVPARKIFLVRNSSGDVAY